MLPIQKKEERRAQFLEIQFHCGTPKSSGGGESLWNAGAEGPATRQVYRKGGAGRERTALEHHSCCSLPACHLLPLGHQLIPSVCPHHSAQAPRNTCWSARPGEAAPGLSHLQGKWSQKTRKKGNNIQTACVHPSLCQRWSLWAYRPGSRSRPLLKPARPFCSGRQAAKSGWHRTTEYATFLIEGSACFHWIFFLKCAATRCCEEDTNASITTPTAWQGWL